MASSGLAVGGLSPWKGSSDHPIDGGFAWTQSGLCCVVQLSHICLRDTGVHTSPPCSDLGEALTSHIVSWQKFLKITNSFLVWSSAVEK